MPYTALYITTSDITDSIARRFVSANDSRLDTWMERTDDEVDAVAMAINVSPENIQTPIHPRIKEYAIAYYCFLIFQDAYGCNEVEDDDNDIYKLKLTYYADRCAALRNQLTKEMFLYESGTDIPASGMVNSAVIWLA
jgi:hypothetical protein